MMKCGGSSVFSALSKWFHLIPDYLEDLNKMEAYVNNRYDINKISSDYCIAGHYHTEGIFVYQRYPEIISRKNEIRCFTFLREPLDFFVSFYYYSRNAGRMELTLREFIETNKNLIAYYLGCDDPDYKEVLDRYFFIGIADKLQESLDIFSQVLNKPKLKLPVLNKSEKDLQMSMITDEYKNKFRKDNELDYKIYNYVRSKLKF